MKTAVCRDCEVPFEIPVQRGRPAVRCTSCKTKSPSVVSFSKNTTGEKEIVTLAVEVICSTEECKKTLRSNNKSGLCSLCWKKNHDRNRRKDPARKLTLAKYQRKYSQSHKKEWKERRKRKITSLRHFLQGIKSYPCIDCGQQFPSYVMQLDHVNPLEKVFDMGRITEHASWTSIVSEVFKCDLVCANCHFARTHGQKIQEYNRKLSIFQEIWK